MALTLAEDTLVEFMTLSIFLQSKKMTMSGMDRAANDEMAKSLDTKQVSDNAIEASRV